MKKAVLLCLVSYILGILAFDAIDASALVFVCIAVAATVCAKRFFIKHGAKYLPLIMCMFFIFGVLYTAGTYSFKTEKLQLLAGETATVTGRIVRVSDTDGEYYDEYEFDVSDIEYGKGENLRVQSGVNRRLELALGKYKLKTAPAAYKYGDVIKVIAELSELERPLNDGDADYARGSMADGIFFSLKGEYAKSEYLGSQLNYFDIRDAAAAARTYCSKVIDSHFAGDEAALLKGMLLSEKTFSDEYRSKLSVSGMTHITVASGLHAACVFAVVLWLCFALRIRKRWAYTISAVFLWLFAFLQGMTPSIIRAVTMLCFYMLAQLLSRDYDNEYILYITAFIMLFANPYMVFDIGFILSFVSVLGIALFSDIFTEYIGRVTGFNRLSSLISMMFAVQILILPLLAFYFNTVSRYSLVANLLIAPVVTVVLVLGFILFALGGLGTVVPSCVAFVLGLLVKYINGVIYAINFLPWASVDIFSMDIVQMCMHYLLMAAAYCYFTKGNKKYNYIPLKICGVLAVCAVVCAVFASSFMSVTFINVGQGDAALIKIPYGKTVVIDGGGSAPTSSYDVGENIFVPYLRRNGVDTIDYAILSHYDKDHAQGIAAAVRLMRVKNLVLPYRENADKEEYKNIIEQSAARRGINVMYFKEGDTLNVGGAVFEALAPTKSTAKKRAMSENNKSLVLKLTYGEASFLFTGDIEEDMLDDVTRHGEKIRSDVLKVPHHGSAASNSAKFIKTTSPKYAIISVGRDNLYDLPSRESIGTLMRANADIYRTDECGTISFYAHSGGIAWIDTTYRRRSEEENFLRSGEGVWLENPQQADWQI